MAATVASEKKDPTGLTITTCGLESKGAETASPTTAHRTQTKDTLLWTSNSPRASGPGCRGDQFDTDLEAMMPPVEGMTSTVSSGLAGRKSLIAPTVNDCQIWPGKEHWKQQAKEAKIQRSCTCLARLSKRTRNVVKLVIVLLIVGVAVSVGVGISKALNAPMYGDKDNSPTR
jgi:hypothetical protein